MESKVPKPVLPRRPLIYFHKTARLSPESRSPPLSKSPYLLQPLVKVSPSTRSRSLKVRTHNVRPPPTFQPRQVAFIYTHHRPSRERPHRSSSLKPISPSRAEVFLKRAPRTDSLNTSQEFDSASDTPSDEPQSLCRSASKSLLLPNPSPPPEPNLAFVRTVFPSYENGPISTLLSPDEASESLNFIQEVQASMEHSDEDAEPFNKGIGCTEDEFHVRATLTSPQLLSDHEAFRSKSHRAPYKKLSLVGLMPLEDLWEHKPVLVRKDRRERAKTYTGAGGFTVLTRRSVLVPEVEYGFSSPVRPATQLYNAKRARSQQVDAKMSRPHSSTSNNL